MEFGAASAARRPGQRKRRSNDLECAGSDGALDSIANGKIQSGVAAALCRRTPKCDRYRRPIDFRFSFDRRAASSTSCVR